MENDMKKFTDIFKCNRCGTTTEAKSLPNGMWLVECPSCKTAELTDEDALLFPEEIEDAEDVVFC